MSEGEPYKVVDELHCAITQQSGMYITIPMNNDTKDILSLMSGLASILPATLSTLEGESYFDIYHLVLHACVCNSEVINTISTYQTLGCSFSFSSFQPLQLNQLPHCHCCTSSFHYSKSRIANSSILFQVYFGQ